MKAKISSFDWYRNVGRVTQPRTHIGIGTTNGGTSLRMGANSLCRAKGYFGEFFRRMRAKLGTAQATTATAHKIARILYHVLLTKEPYSYGCGFVSGIASLVGWTAVISPHGQKAKSTRKVFIVLLAVWVGR